MGVSMLQIGHLHFWRGWRPSVRDRWHGKLLAGTPSLVRTHRLDRVIRRLSWGRKRGPVLFHCPGILIAVRHRIGGCRYSLASCTRRFVCHGKEGVAVRKPFATWINTFYRLGFRPTKQTQKPPQRRSIRPGSEPLEYRAAVGSLLVWSIPLELPGAFSSITSLDQEHGLLDGSAEEESDCVERASTTWSNSSWAGDSQPLLPSESLLAEPASQREGGDDSGDSRQTYTAASETGFDAYKSGVDTLLAGEWSWADSLLAPPYPSGSGDEDSGSDGEPAFQPNANASLSGSVQSGSSGSVATESFGGEGWTGAAPTGLGNPQGSSGGMSSDLGIDTTSSASSLPPGGNTMFPSGSGGPSETLVNTGATSTPGSSATVDLGTGGNNSSSGASAEPSGSANGNQGGGEGNQGAAQGLHGNGGANGDQGVGSNGHDKGGHVATVSGQGRFKDKPISLVSREGSSLNKIKVHPAETQENIPAGVDLPVGIVQFSLEDITAGEATTIVMTLPEGATADRYLKFGPTPEIRTPHWYDFTYDGATGAEFRDGQITLHYVDGQRGDDDLMANGVIVDPGGPGQTEEPGFRPLVTVEASDSDAAEAGTDPVTFSFHRGGDSSNPLTVYYVLGGSAGPDTDYATNPASGDNSYGSIGVRSITIPAGSAATTLTITPQNDQTAEANETVQVTLVYPPLGDVSDQSGSPDTAQPTDSAYAAYLFGYDIGTSRIAAATIQDNDSAAVVTVSTNVASIDELDSRTATFTIARTGITSSSLTVFYKVAGQAEPGIDYTGLPNYDHSNYEAKGSITIPAGSTSTQITITAAVDAIAEGSESLILAVLRREQLRRRLCSDVRSGHRGEQLHRR